MKTNTATIAALAFGAFALMAWSKTKPKKAAAPWNPIYMIDDPFAARASQESEIRKAAGLQNLDYLNSFGLASSNKITAGWTT